MPSRPVTRRRAALGAALAALLVYLPALGNGFTLDDAPVIEENPRAHSVVAALRAFDEPWWPPPHDAGQWRPLTTLSLATDWQLSGGSPRWLHAGNMLWHALATGLVVLFIAPWVGAAGALAGGLLFAVHPVHVEAVANLVGRAELMAAVFVLLALLAGRAARRADGRGAPTWLWEAATLGALLLGLLSKEHAAVAIALLALDGLAGGAGSEAGRLPRRCWLLAALLTAGWFLARREVEGGMSFVAVAPTFFGLDASGRIATMLPVVFDVLRLLIWPLRLSPDYHPEVVPRLESLTPLGVAGGLLLVCLIVLALRLWQRHRPAAAALLLIGIAWLPTANLLFPSGVVLAERTLYLSSVGVCLLAGLAWSARPRRWEAAIRVLAVALVLGFAVRTAVRVPVWRSTRDLVIEGVVNRPESYKVQQAAARVLMKTGQVPQALRTYTLAAELYPRDPYLLTEAGSAALAAGQPRLALRFLRRSLELDSTYTLTRQLTATATSLLADSLGGADSGALR